MSLRHAPLSWQPGAAHSSKDESGESAQQHHVRMCLTCHTKASGEAQHQALCVSGLRLTDSMFCLPKRGAYTGSAFGTYDDSLQQKERKFP